MSSVREGEPQQAGGPAPTTDPVGEEKAHAAGGRELVKARSYGETSWTLMIAIISSSSQRGR